MSKSMKFLLLAGVMSLAVAPAVQAGGKVTGSDFHASAAPACNGTSRTQKKAEDGLSRNWCRVLATDGGPSTAGDHNGRSAALVTGDWQPVLAEDGPPGTAGDRNGRAELTIDTHRMFATEGAPGGANDNNGRAELPTNSHQMFAGDGGPTGAGDHNGRSAALSQSGGEYRVAASKPSSGGNINI